MCLLFLIHQLLSVRTTKGDECQSTHDDDDQPKTTARHQRLSTLSKKHESFFLFFFFLFSFFSVNTKKQTKFRFLLLFSRANCIRGGKIPSYTCTNSQIHVHRIYRNRLWLRELNYHKPGFRDAFLPTPKLL